MFDAWWLDLPSPEPNWHLRAGVVLLSSRLRDFRDHLEGGRCPREWAQGTGPWSLLPEQLSICQKIFFFFNPWKILLKNSLPVKSWAGRVKKSMILVTVFVKGENSSCENKWCSLYSGPPCSCPPIHGLLFSYLLVSAESQRNSILEIHTGLHRDEQIRHATTDKRRTQVHCLLTCIWELDLIFWEPHLG